jgi:hypothetical protein
MNVQLPIPKLTEELLPELKRWGVFAILFVALLSYVLYTGNQRERELISVIKSTTPVLEQLQRDMTNVSCTVDAIKDDMRKGDR